MGRRGSLWSGVYYAIHLYHVARRLEVDRWRAEAAAREAQLRSLESQLDPHFMFNSLNGIRGMIAENPSQAREMVTQLAATLRYALRTSRAVTVPLDEETRERLRGLGYLQ